MWERMEVESAVTRRPVSMPAWHRAHPKPPPPHPGSHHWAGMLLRKVAQPLGCGLLHHGIKLLARCTHHWLRHGRAAMHCQRQRSAERHRHRRRHGVAHLQRMVDLFWVGV